MVHGVYCLAFVLPLAAVSPAAAQFADTVVAVPMGGSVYMLQGAGDVIAVSVGADGVLLVDDGFMRTVPAVRRAIARLGGGSPRIVINTHWHHAGANEAFAKDATIIAHARARDRLRDGAVMYTQEVPGQSEVALPDVVFTDSISLFFNGERIDLLYLPRAHTDSDIAVLFTESKVAALGDLFVPFIPITDYASGGDLYSSVGAVEMLLERLDPEVRIVPGHGRPSTYDDLRRFREMLRGMIDYVEGGVRRGWTADQLVAQGIPERWQSWRGDLLPDEFVLRNLYEGVTRPAP